MRQLLFTGMIVLSFVQCFPDCVLEKGYSINADETSGNRSQLTVCENLTLVLDWKNRDDNLVIG